MHIFRSSETELIDQCRRRVRTAQMQLYDLYAGKLFAVCKRYIKDSMEAEDVLITAFTKILEKVDQYKGEGSFEGWMKRIVINDALTWLRRNRSMYIETNLEAADCEPNYDQMSDQLEVEDLLTMIQELPPGYRMVFNLYAIDGLSHQEIAQQLGISENTSKSQLSRARNYLQKLLADHESIQQKSYKS